ncbi:MAG: type IV toxin-antitoxin system AbiEi family antitoxin [Gammaproteobacteria bacterium]|nr:type IV toxin-antitoxin system AbiEi family antitoxin [Gammaproteobacteria bacterium]
MINVTKRYRTGAARDFIDERLSRGFVSFSLSEIVKGTGLSVVAARNQLLRLKDAVVRVSPRQQYFLIVQPQHRILGAPPVEWWLNDYFKWLGQPYYLALLSAAATYGSSHQAVQETEIITQVPRRVMIIGRRRLRFFVKSSIDKTITQQLPRAYAPLTVSTPESTVFDLVRYAQRIGGFERAAETIVPMLSMITSRALSRVLEAENDMATAQRLTMVFEAIGAKDYAEAVKNWGNSVG